MSSKLSNEPNPHVLNTHDINKKILAKAVFVRSEFEYLGVQNKYRADEYKNYKMKKVEFYERVKKYKELNKGVLVHKRNKLDADTNVNLTYAPEFEPDIFSKVMRPSILASNTTGSLLRCRSLRRIHEVNVQTIEVCTLEPWFARYLTLCKFIYAARIVILKNRLLKNLETLRKLDKETIEIYESGHRKFENVSYSHIFEKFIN